MAKFLKSIKKSIDTGVHAVEHGINISLLDTIVHDLTKDYVCALDQFVAARTALLTDAQEAEQEAAWRAQFNAFYDRRAAVAVNRPVPPTWQESADLVSVRKRMLNRALDQRARQINVKIGARLGIHVVAAPVVAAPLVADMQAQFDAARDLLTDFVRDAASRLPVRKLQLRNECAANRGSIESIAAAARAEAGGRAMRPTAEQWNGLLMEATAEYADLGRQNDAAIEEDLAASFAAMEGDMTQATRALLTDWLNRSQSILMSKTYLSEEDAVESVQQHRAKWTNASSKVLAGLAILYYPTNGDH